MLQTMTGYDTDPYPTPSPTPPTYIPDRKEWRFIRYGILFLNVTYSILYG